MQKSSVVVVADKTSLKRPFIFANAVHMVGKAFFTRPVLSVCYDANIVSKVSIQLQKSHSVSLTSLYELNVINNILLTSGHVKLS